jgi:hypothetical protein
MSGPSKTVQDQQQTTNTNNSFAPWAMAQPLLGGILGSAAPLAGTAGGVTPTESDAFNTLMANAQSGNPYALPIAGYASNLLSGGGATAQAPAVQGAYDTLNARLSPIADQTPGTPTPQLQAVYDALGNDITNRTNAYYAGAGRDLSGANAFNLTRGLATGLAPAVLAQFNTDLQNKIGAANALYSAGTGTAGILGGLTQTALANQGQGVDAASAALAARDSAANQQLAIEAAKRGIPLSTLSALTQIGVPLAQVGGTSTGTAARTGTVDTTAYMSPQQQAWGWMNAFGNLGKAAAG